jgi:hypothetical protein
MTELAKDVTAIDVTDLLTRYSFDLGGCAVESLVDSWLHHYPVQWVRLAVIEALYQGRYKAFSVEQILNLWQRRGKSLYRFNHEFERIICGRPNHSSTLSRSRRSSPRWTPAKTELTGQVQSALHPISMAPSTNQTVLTNPEESLSVPLALEQLAESQSPTPDLVVKSVDPDSAVPAAPATGSRREPVSPFKPDERIELEPLVAMSSVRVHQQPIHQFVPASEFPDFHAKLKLVAQGVADEMTHLT